LKEETGQGGKSVVNSLIESEFGKPKKIPVAPSGGPVKPPPGPLDAIKNLIGGRPQTGKPGGKASAAGSQMNQSMNNTQNKDDRQKSFKTIFTITSVIKKHVSHSVMERKKHAEKRSEVEEKNKAV
jgi:hypothetical protein